MKPIYKILLVAGIIIVVGLIVYLVWGQFTAPAPASPTATSTPALPNLPSGNQNNLSVSGISSSSLLRASALKKLSDGPVFDFWLVPDSNEVYYFTPNGQVMAAKDGPDLLILNQNINALNAITVAPGDKKILAAFGNPNTPQWGIFDLLDKAWRPLPGNILNAAWSVTDSKLIALVQNGNFINLAWADLSKNPPAYQVLVRDFRLEDVKISVLPNQKIILAEKPSASYDGRIWQFDPKTLTLNLLENPLSGLILGWSKDKALAFQFSAPNNFLVLTGDLKSGLSSILETFPSKCAAAATSTVYCFAPQSFPPGLILPDDYLQKKFHSIDNLVTLSLKSGDVNNVFSSGLNNFPAIDARNPQIMGDNLYFVNRYDGYLYELGLGGGQ